MTSRALFDRDFVLRIGDRLIRNTDQSTLRIEFKVTRTLGREPNKADISITNLNEESRALFQEKNRPVVLEAGYRENTSIIFNGRVANTDIEQLPTGWLVRVEATDAGANPRRARINRSQRGAAGLGDLAGVALEALGVGQGNLADLGAPAFQNGAVISGRADQQVEKLARRSRARFSIQDGQALFLRRGQVRRGPTPLISASSGMVGSPQIGERGAVTLTAKIQPNLAPGFGFRLESRTVSGFYRVEKATYTGDSWGNAWIVAIEGAPI